MPARTVKSLPLYNIAACLLSATALISGHQQHGSTRADDPLFGQGCRYVVVETGTPVQPSATICRPYV